MPEKFIDLHCHSTASDGRLTPTQLVQRAKETGLAALALTDHDTVAGVKELKSAGATLGVETVSGVEISTDYAKGEMHLIGLFVRDDQVPFQVFLKRLADGRKTRNPLIIEKLNALGLSLTMAEVEADAGLEPGARGALDKNVGRPHIASVLVKKGYVKTKQEAFDEYLAKGKRAYLPRVVATPEEALRQLHAAGGLTVLAHPPFLGGDEAQIESVVAGLRALGLDGIEVYYSLHTPAQTEFCARLARKYDLLVSGGSDYHENGVAGGIELGTGVRGNLRVPYSVLEALRERAVARGRG